MVGMVGTVGADVEGVRALAAALEEAVADLGRARADVDRVLTDLPWTGARSAVHRDRWAQQDAATLSAAAQVLAAAAAELRTQADAQEEASAPVTAPVTAAAPTLWREWERRWQPVSLAIGAAPWVGAVTTWRDAVRTSWRDTVAHADQWSRANLGGPVARALDALAAVGAGVSGWRIGTAVREGDWVRAGTEGAGLGVSLASASQVAAARAAGGVGLAAQGGWWVGSWIHDTWGDTAPMVWIGDHVVGPVGDVVVGVVDADARARTARRWGL